MQAPFFYVLNWKMYLNYQEQLHWCDNNRTALQELVQANKNTRIVICPSFVALPSVHGLLMDTNIFTGAQTISSHPSGPFTGQIDAQSLADVGCAYCIVGHSERRTEFHETDTQVAEQVIQLIKHNITPIVCVGETKEQKEAGETVTIIREQLLPIAEVISSTKTTKPVSLVIAYEPVWAIGGITTPSKKEIEMVFAAIKNEARNLIPTTPLTLLYGGSVDETTMQELYKIHDLGGFLLGRASLDFQKLKNIVTWSK